MESIVHFIMSNGTTVITALLGSVIFCVFGLLIMSFHSPKHAVAQDVGTIDRLEGVLKQMMSEQTLARSNSSGGDMSEVALLKEQVTVLEREVKEKNKILESGGSGSDEESSALKLKINELEAKLAEYSIIEEDISDLSKYRQENEELKNRINEVTGVPAAEALAMPWEDFEKVVKNKKSTSPKEDVQHSIQQNTES